MEREFRAVPGYREPFEIAPLPQNSPVLVALSGGEDSMTLLMHMMEYARRYGAPLYAAHVQHGIRGEEAKRDLAFCRAVTARLGITLYVLETDIPAICRETGEGMEEAARRVRYEWFAHLMEEYDIPLLAVAHHAADQAETVLLHMARGCGLRGLCGMRAARPFGPGWLIRPLLACRKADISAFCRENSVAFVTDSTNSEQKYARNHIRAGVLPVMTALNPAYEQAVVQMTDALAQDEDFLMREAQKQMDGAVKKTGEGVYEVDLTRLMPAHAALRRRVWLLLLETAGCRPAQTVYIGALEQLAGGRTGAEVSLPGGMRAVRLRENRICLCRAVQAVPDIPPTPVALDFSGSGGVCRWGDFNIFWSEKEFFLPDGAKKSQKEKNIYNLSKIVVLNSDKIIRSPFLRARQPGDVLLTNGMHKKVRRLCAEAGVPSVLRAALPLLCDGEGVLWIPGVAQRQESREGAGKRLWLYAAFADPGYREKYFCRGEDTSYGVDASPAEVQTARVQKSTMESEGSHEE